MTQKKAERRQSAIMDFIEQFTSEKGFPPTTREICQALEIKSTSTVNSDLKLLKETGRITYIDAKPRTLKVLRQTGESGEDDRMPADEDLQKICNLLLPALQATRSLYDLKQLIYNEESETVTAVFEGGTKTVFVGGDSGISMARDILSKIV